MSSIVLELQRELLDENCDVLQALRKAHVISVKLRLSDFDAWIQSELNGYKCDPESIPDYRQMKGELKAKNPMRGWIPAVIAGKGANSFSTVAMRQSLSALIEISKQTADNGYFWYSYPPELSLKLCEQAGAPTYMEIAVFISTYHITEAVEQVKNCLLEWTLKLEENGIMGENMSFNEQETRSAKDIPQQINNYYGTIVNGNISDSQIVSGNSNTAAYNAAAVQDVITEIRESINKEPIAKEDLESILETLEDISEKISQNKKPGVIKTAFMGLRDFVISAGAEVTGALISAKISNLF